MKLSRTMWVIGAPFIAAAVALDATIAYETWQIAGPLPAIAAVVMFAWPVARRFNLV